MSTNRVLQFLPVFRCCPECSKRRNRERMLDAVRDECERIERLSGGILEFLPPAVDYEDDDGMACELEFIWRARPKSLLIDAIAFESRDVAPFVLAELRRLAQIYQDAAECVEAGGVYFPPSGTLEDCDQDGDQPVSR